MDTLVCAVDWANITSVDFIKMWSEVKSEVPKHFKWLLWCTKLKKIRRYCLKPVSCLFLKVAIAYNVLCYTIVL